MIRKLIILSCLLISFSGFSKGKESLPSVWIIKDSVSKSIHPDSVKLVFDISDQYDQLMLNQHAAIIQVKMDGKTKKYTVTNKERSFKITLAKGMHHLSFYVNANFEEIHLNREFTGSHYYEFGLNFQENFPSHRDIMLEKPVIYLYSESSQAFNLKIQTNADLQFTYPAYENGWKGTASADGTIQINGSNYPYLFWDASLPVENLNPDWQNSDQLLGEQVIPYLTSQLDHLGFNPKEKTDFITYWGPRMQKMKYLRVLWIQNESINEIAALDITPEFTQNRIYILFKEVNDLTDETLQLKLNQLKPIRRTKNCLIEWGGIELKPTI